MKEKILELAQEILAQVKEASKKNFADMSLSDQTSFLQEQSYLNGQLSIINKVMEIMREGR